MRVKAQGLLNAAKWIQDEYGREGLRDVLRACPERVRERYTSVIAIDWHPVDEFIELVDAAEKVLGAGHSHGRIAEAIGGAGARANMRGTLIRLAIWISRPESMMSRVAALWSQFNDEGAMELRRSDNQASRVEVIGLKNPHPLFCAVLTGWCREVAIAIRAVTPVARHLECKARGDPRCVWEVRYARVEPNAAGGVPPPRDPPPRE